MEEFGEREVVIKRTFDAPRELVFTAWTDSRHMAQWWGPRGFTNPVCEIEARVGGAIHVVMRGPDGTDHAMKGGRRTYHVVNIREAAEVDDQVKEWLTESYIDFAP